MAPEQVAGTSGESFRAASAPEGRGMGALVCRGVLADGEGGNLQKAGIFHWELLSPSRRCVCNLHPGPGFCSRFGLSCLHWLSGCLLELRPRSVAATSAGMVSGPSAAHM